MKINNFKRKMLGVLAGGVAAASIASTTVMAASEGDNVNDSNVTITKDITKQSKAFAPAVTFEFTIAPAAAVATVDGVAIAKIAEANESNIYVGPAGGATLESSSITSAPKAEDIGKTTVTAGTTKVKLDNSKFKAPGIYRYVVKETAGTYEGITYNTDPMYFDVYVDNTNTPYSYSFVKSDDSKVKSDGHIVNDYE